MFVDAVCSGLDASEWDLPTACPGWSVKDHLSHLTDGAGSFLGRPRRDDTLPEDIPHVRNPAARWMEVGVEARRGKGAEEVLADS